MKDINPGQVYAILAAQLVLTMAFIGLFFIPTVKVGSPALDSSVLCCVPPSPCPAGVRQGAPLAGVGGHRPHLPPHHRAGLRARRQQEEVPGQLQHLAHPILTPPSPHPAPPSPQNLLLLWLLTCCIGFTLGQCPLYCQTDGSLGDVWNERSPQARSRRGSRPRRCCWPWG